MRVSMEWAKLRAMADEIFPFKYFDPVRQRWTQARYKATQGEIGARYAQWEITGPGWTPGPGGAAGHVQTPPPKRD